MKKDLYARLITQYPIWYFFKEPVMSSDTDWNSKILECQTRDKLLVGDWRVLTSGNWSAIV